MGKRNSVQCLSTVVAYQGEPGAFSEQAALGFFGSQANLKPVRTFQEVFSFVARSNAHRGIVPIENSVFGSIHQNYDLLLQHKLSIVGEVKLRIRLHLMALPGVPLRLVQSVYSQPQALGQCEDFLRTLKRVRVLAHHDTAAAARMIAERQDKTLAAIASARASGMYGLRILKRNVESNHQNYTRFIVLGRKPAAPRPQAKTSLVFAVKNDPGALVQALSVFSKNEVNLLKIESRPRLGKPWEYLFYLDIEGSFGDKPVRRALNHLEEVCIFTRVLGSYSRALMAKN